MAWNDWVEGGGGMTWGDYVDRYWTNKNTGQVTYQAPEGWNQEYQRLYSQFTGQGLDPAMASAYTNATMSGLQDFQQGQSQITPSMVSMASAYNPQTGQRQSIYDTGQYDPGTSDQRALLAAAAIFGGAALAPASMGGMGLTGGTGVAGEIGAAGDMFGSGAVYDAGVAGLGAPAAAGAAGVETGAWPGTQPMVEGPPMVNLNQGGPIQTLPDMMLGGGEVMAGPGAVDLTAGGLGGLGVAPYGGFDAGAVGGLGAAGAGAAGAGASGAIGGGAVGGLGAGSAALGGSEALAAGALGGQALGDGGYSGSPTGGGGGIGSALMTDDWWKYLLPGVPGLIGALGAGSIAEDMEDQAHAYQQMGAPYRSRLESLYTPEGIQAFMQSPEVTVPVQQGTDMLARSLSVGGNPAGSGNALQQLQNYSTNQLYSRLGQERDRLGGFGGLTAYNQAAPQALTNSFGMTNQMYGNLGGMTADILNPPRRYSLEDFMRGFG